jgi:acyl-CoA synthetase (AMP-forming)/AMP-acid ligase II
MHSSLQASLYHQLERCAGQRLLGFMDAAKGVTWLTGHEVYDRARHCAGCLAAHGVKAGNPCILVLPSGQWCANVVLGALMCGAVPLLIAPPLLTNSASNFMAVLTRLLRQTKARLVICPDSFRGITMQVPTGRRGVRFVFGEAELASDSCAPAPPLATPRPTDVAALQLTSGTTGVPRICVWKQANVLAALSAMAAAMALRADDVCVNWTPLYHDMGLVNNFFLCLHEGVPLAQLSPFEFVKRPVLWLRGLSETSATLSWSPNFGFAITAQRVTNQELMGVRLYRVRALWNAAERIHLKTVEAFGERFGPFGLSPQALKTNYGCAENVGGATFSNVGGMFVHEHLDREALYRRRRARPVAATGNGVETVSVVGVGRPAPGIQIHILSPRGIPLPEEMVGEVALETPSRMAGYLGQTRATRRALYGKLLRTGDLGYIRGQELFWVGRLRERITVRGRKLDPSESEAVLVDVVGLRHGCFVAFGVDDDKSGTQRVVILAEVPDPPPRPPAEIIHHVRERVIRNLGIDANEVILVRPGSLPKTSSGKRRHRHFRQLYQSGNPASYVPKLQEARP